MFSSAQIITGERVQELADIYIGTEEDFRFNPRIHGQRQKQMSLEVLQQIEKWHNPRVVFFYTHRMHEIAENLDKFAQPAVLLSHNSDHNVVDCADSRRILEHPMLVKWFSQNVCFEHDKLHLMPIGLANSMWRHGNLIAFDMPAPLVKKSAVFFNFQIATNRTIRQPCFDALKSYYPFLPNADPVDNHRRLQEYKFCISPEGNGADCHRLWEALYSRVVPIVLRTAFTETLVRNGLPVLVVDSWDKVPQALSEVKYENFDFSVVSNYTMDSIRVQLYK